MVNKEESLMVYCEWNIGPLFHNINQTLESGFTQLLKTHLIPLASHKAHQNDLTQQNEAMFKMTLLCMYFCRKDGTKMVATKGQCAFADNSLGHPPPSWVDSLLLLLHTTYSPVQPLTAEPAAPTLGQLTTCLHSGCKTNSIQDAKNVTRKKQKTIAYNNVHRTCTDANWTVSPQKFNTYNL